MTAEVLEATGLGSDMFVFDNVVHVHNFDPSNLVDGLAERANLNIYTGSTKTFPPDLRFGNYANFAKAWSVEDIHRIIFDESNTDMAMAQAVPLYDYWKDGLAGVERQHALMKLDPERVVFCGAVDPVYQGLPTALESMTYQVEQMGARSFKLYNGHRGRTSWSADDRDLAYPIYRRALDLGVTMVQFHKGLPLGMEPIESLRPNDLQVPAIDFPEINFVIHHLGIPYQAETIDIARRFPNIYLSLSSWINYLALRPVPTLMNLGEALFACGPEKLLWGSEVPLWPAAQPLIDLFLSTEIPQHQQDGYAHPQLTREMKEMIMGRNLARLLDIEIPAKYAR
jgi:predicted TIM-barrel fold metal-dependent hydrolase